MNDDVNDKKEEDGLHTFDMYHLFNRWDLILVLGFVIVVLLAVLYFVMFRGGAV